MWIGFKACIVLLAAEAASAAEYVGAAPAIRARSELPPTLFQPPAPPSEMLDSPKLLDFLRPVAAEARLILRNYRIEDPVVLGELLRGLAGYEALVGNIAEAMGLVAQYRAQQTKPALKQIGALPLELAIVRAGAAPDSGCRAPADRLTERLAAVAPAEARDTFLKQFVYIQRVSPNLERGLLATEMDRTMKTRGGLDVLDALLLARIEAGLKGLPPCRDALVAAGRAWLDQPENQPVDIWPAREPSTAQLRGAAPIIVAVWDSGLDSTLFPGQMAIDPAEPLDGRDNDGNGVVDDVHGPTYDHRLYPRSSAIQPATAALSARMGSATTLMKGTQDAVAGLDTPEARMATAHLRSTDAATIAKDAAVDLELGWRNHGTAVASVIADGAPHVRLYNVAALYWAVDENGQPIGYDETVVERWVQVTRAAGARMRGAGVRIANLSWGESADEITRQLLDSGLETDAARARQRGAAMFRTVQTALLDLFRQSPDILFVIAAGNSNQPEDIAASVAQTTELPNVLNVGATGASGRPTDFTTFGPNVRIYAKGETVRVRWPGDMVALWGGTSFSAPHVARAAAAMLAVAPTLTTVEVREGLIATATPDGDIRMLHTAAAVDWAKARGSAAARPSPRKQREH